MTRAKNQQILKKKSVKWIFIWAASRPYFSFSTLVFSSKPNLTLILNSRREEAAERPKTEFVPKSLSDLIIENEGK